MRLRGYCAIGVYHPKNVLNIGTLWRSAYVFGAALLFTVGRRYKTQASDVPKAWRTIPLIHFDTVQDLRAHLPYTCRLVGVELVDDATPIQHYVHLERACYLLGAEDTGLPPAVLAACHTKLILPGRDCLNVATAGSIVLYDRALKATMDWKSYGR